MRKVDRLTKAAVKRVIKDVDKARAAKHAVKPKLITDGNGLYLQVPELSFISRLRIAGRRVEPGHGSARSTSLKDARAANKAARRQIAAGTNPVLARVQARAKAFTSMTFLAAAKAFMPVIEAELQNAKSREQWRTTLTGENVKHDANGKPITIKAKHNYCKALHPIPVADVSTDLVLAVLNPIWSTKHETASRLRGRIERVLAWAVRQGKAGDVDIDRYLNPARWEGHLEHALSAKAPDVEHHAALPYTEMPTFYAALAKQGGLAARAFQLAILTATRTGDLRGADREERPPMMWEHLDLEAPTWTVPKTKTAVTHRIPLSKAAVALLEQIKREYPVDRGGTVFVGDKPGRPMSNTAMLAVRNRMVSAGLIAKGSVTPHGMARAGFKSWASEETTFPKDVIEACLSHTIPDAVEKAYRRTDFYRKRVQLMQAWADFVTGAAGKNVVAMPSVA